MALSPSPKVSFLLGVWLLSSAALQAAEAPALDRLPIAFVENRGQWRAPLAFAASRGPIAAAFEPHAIRLTLGAPRAASVALVFEGASKDVTLAGEGRRRGVYNFYAGRDR